MALRFIGIDPDTDQANCPAVWVDNETKEIVLQGWLPDEETKTVCATNSPLPDSEGIVRLPFRMVDIIRKACDEAEGSQLR